MKAVLSDSLENLTEFMHRYRGVSVQSEDDNFRDFKGTFLRLKEGANQLENLPSVEFRRRFEHFRATMNEMGEAKLVDFCEEFACIRKQMENIFPPDKTEAPEFNIFSILKVSRYEVKTHSPFLAELLDPRGSHEQGYLFLSSFLQLLPNDFGLDQLSVGSWEVQLEKYTAKGILDIVISNYRTRHIVVIENKIYSGDRQDQMRRYHEWLTNHPHFTEAAKRRLIYLTLGGSPPSNAAIEDGCYKCMSYRYDIRAWLEAVIPKVESLRVSDCVRQYLDVISKLSKEA